MTPPLVSLNTLFRAEPFLDVSSSWTEPLSPLCGDLPWSTCALAVIKVPSLTLRKAPHAALAATLWSRLCFCFSLPASPNRSCSCMNCGLWTRADFRWALAVGQCFGLFLPSPVLTVGHEPLSPCPSQAGRGVIPLSGKQKQAQMLHRFSFLLAQIAFLFCLVTVSVCGGCLSAAPTLSSEVGPLAEPGSHPSG